MQIFSCEVLSFQSSEELTQKSLAVAKAAADEGKCYDNAMKEVKLPKHESWSNYATWFPGNVERYCLLYRSGF
jgi:hypothetical protein